MRDAIFYLNHKPYTVRVAEFAHHIVGLAGTDNETCAALYDLSRSRATRFILRFEEETVSYTGVWWGTHQCYIQDSFCGGILRFYYIECRRANDVR